MFSGATDGSVALWDMSSLPAWRADSPADLAWNGIYDIKVLLCVCARIGPSHCLNTCRECGGLYYVLDFPFVFQVQTGPVSP